jgi:protein-tyrosine phosphatase
MKIMFVCHGNICRSPMAELVMRDLVKKKGLSERVQVASCATSTEEIWNGIGSPIYPPARRELARHAIPVDENKRAVQLRRDDYEKYDLFVGMDSANIRNMHRILGGDPDGKICKLLSFVGSERDVADPWYTGDFDATWQDVWEGCNALLSSLDLK